MTSLIVFAVLLFFAPVLLVVALIVGLEVVVFVFLAPFRVLYFLAYTAKSATLLTCSVATKALVKITHWGA